MVVALERELQTKACRGNRARVLELLAPDFADVGASGRSTGGIMRVLERLRERHPSLVSMNLAERGLRLADIRNTQLTPALDFGPDLAIVAGGGNDAIRPNFDDDSMRREMT
jgi:hypothetical protein